MAYSEWRQLKAHLTRCVLSPGCVVAHVGVYLVAGTILVLVNAIGSPGELWFWRPLLILGAMLVLHTGLIMAAGRMSRLRVVALMGRSLWSRFLANRPSWAVDRVWPAAPLQLLETWWRSFRPGPLIAKQAASFQRATLVAQQPPVTPGVNGLEPATVQLATEEDRQPVSWAAATPYDSWPAAPPAAAPPIAWTATPPTTWPASTPAWTASWPTRPAPPSLPPVRPTGSDTVLDGAHAANPEHPRWDQLEGAASAWLAQRAADATVESVR